MFSSWVNRPNGDRVMERSCGHADCIRKLMEGAAVIRCAGLSCGKEFHIECTEITKCDYEVFKRYQCISYRCPDCLIFDNEMKNSVLKLNQKMSSVLTSVISKQSKMEIALSERISKIENVMHESGKSIVSEMTKMVDEVTKVVDEKSTEMTRVMEQTIVENDSEWHKVEKKKKKPKDKVIVITPSSNQSRTELKKSLRSSIDASKFNVNGISRTSKNGIAVKCKDDESIDKLIEEVRAKFGEDVNTKRPKEMTPRIKILRVNDPELCDKAFIDQLKIRNPFLTDSNMNVLRRENVKRNGMIIDGVFNMVLEVDGESYEKIMTEKKLKHHFEVYRVVDSIYIRRCYQCWGFNHHRIDCKNDLACPKCAGNHEAKECNNETKKCINCIKFNERVGTSLDFNHDVWSSQCGVFKKKLERSRKLFANVQ